MEWMLVCQKEQAREIMEACNRKTRSAGLTLTPDEMAGLLDGRERALRDTGRMEFGEGVLPALTDAFGDSPDIRPEDWADTLLTLQDVFYHLKREAGDGSVDGAILRLMRSVFDRKAGGSAELLAGWTLNEMRQMLEEQDEEWNGTRPDDGGEQ